MASHKLIAKRDNESTVAIISCVTSDFMRSEDLVRLIRQAVGNWLALSYSGREAWTESSEDFNWGDLSMYCMDNSLIHHLKAKGIFSLEISTIQGAGDIALSYDEILKPSEVPT